MRPLWPLGRYAPVAPWIAILSALACAYSADASAMLIYLLESQYCAANLFEDVPRLGLEDVLLMELHKIIEIMLWTLRTRSGFSFLVFCLHSD